MPTDAPHVYVVQSQSNDDIQWVVDLQLGECSFPIGFSGKPCKHQLAASAKYMKNSVNSIPTESPQGRQFFAVLALGSSCQNISFYSSVHQKADEEHLWSLSVDVQWSNEDVKKLLEGPLSPFDDPLQDCVRHDIDQDHIITGNGTYEINRVETVRKQLCHVMDDIENGLGNSISSEDGFLAAVEKFCSTYWKITHVW